MTSFCPHCGEPLPTGPDGLPSLICPRCQPEPAARREPTPPPLLAEPTTPLPWELQPPTPPEFAQTAPVGEAIAWEGEGNFFKRLGKTIWQVATRPSLVFRGPFKPGLAWPLAFALILQTLVMGLEILHSGQSILSPLHLPLPLLLALSPLETLGLIFLESILVHLFLMMMNGAKGKLPATFRATCYAAAISPLALLPYVGTPLSFIWSLVVEVKGLSTGHGTGAGKPLAALVLAFIVIMVLIALLSLGSVMEIDFRSISPRRPPLSL